MANEAVCDITQGGLLPEGGKLTPGVISRSAEVPWVNHFVAQEAREYCSYG